MTEPNADSVLRDKVLTLLERELGLADSLRFLASMSRQPFDYQRWRNSRFDGLSLREILDPSRQS